MVEQELQKLLDMVKNVGGIRPCILRNPFASQGAPEVVFEREASDLETLESQIKAVTARDDFQQWTGTMSGLLAQSPKREIYITD